MRRARKSGALRPSGRLLESRSDPGPRGMIAALRGCGVSVQIGARVARRTESGLQAHPLIFYKLRTQNRKHDVKHDAGTEGRNEEQEAYEGFARLAGEAGTGCAAAAA